MTPEAAFSTEPGQEAAWAPGGEDSCPHTPQAPASELSPLGACWAHPGVEGRRWAPSLHFTAGAGASLPA